MAKARRAKVRRASKSHHTVGCLQASRQQLRLRPCIHVQLQESIAISFRVVLQLACYIVDKLAAPPHQQVFDQPNAAQVLKTMLQRPALLVMRLDSSYCFAHQIQTSFPVPNFVLQLMILFQDQLRIWFPQSAGVLIVALGCTDSFALNLCKCDWQIQRAAVSYLAFICS